MMVFVAGKEKVYVDVDNENNIRISNNQTGMQWVVLNEEFFPEQRKKLEFRYMVQMLNGKPKEQVEDYIIDEFKKMGYKQLVV